MKKLEITVSLSEYADVSELKSDETELITASRNAMQNAYAPYSRFRVGAAVRLANGVIVTGNNQENASYPVGLCAERVALFSASANHPGVPINSIAITATSGDFEVTNPVMPCGACRQAIAEYEGLQGIPIRLYLSCDKPVVHVAAGIDNLLPFRFKGESLKHRR